MTELTNFLTEMADRIKAANEAVAAAEQITAEKMIEAGTLLCQAKDASKHGEWTPFLARAGIADRQAQRLMQIARSGLKPDTCRELGGVKATLAYLAKKKLPAAGELLLVGPEGWAEGDERPPLIMISRSKKHPDYFDCVQLVLDHDIIEQLPTVQAEGALAFIEFHHVPASEREFTTVPEEIIFPAPTEAKEASEEYNRVVGLLRDCVADFTADKYIAAIRAVQSFEFRSEQWPITQKLLDTYISIAKDDEMMRLCAEVQKMARAA